VPAPEPAMPHPKPQPTRTLTIEDLLTAPTRKLRRLTLEEAALRTRGDDAPAAADAPDASPPPRAS
jgi:hypothetical protein